MNQKNLQYGSEVRCVVDCTTGMAILTVKQKTYLKQCSTLRYALQLRFIFSQWYDRQ